MKIRYFSISALRKVLRFVILLLTLLNICNVSGQNYIIKLKAKDKDERSHAVYMLGEMKEPKAVDPLITLLRSERDTEIQLKIIEALGEIGSPISVLPLIDVLNNPILQEQSIFALGKLKDPRAVMPLIDLLKNDTTVPSNPHTAECFKYHIVAALGEIKDTRAVIPLIELLQKTPYHQIGDPCFLKRQIIEALGEIGDSSAVESLLVTLVDRDYSVRIGSANALGTLKSIKAINPLISTSLKDEVNSVRNAGTQALGKIGTHRVVKPLISVLQDESQYVRQSAIAALGRLKEVEAIPALVNSLKDWWGKSYAIIALQGFGWEPSSIEDSIHQLLVNVTFNRAKLKTRWAKTKEILFIDLASKNNIVREYAVCALISIGEQELIPTLIVTLNTKGTENIALAFLNSGNIELSSAAESWAKNNGYRINSSGGESNVKWGGR